MNDNLSKFNIFVTLCNELHYESIIKRNHMKKVLLFSLVVLFAASVSAQRYSDSTWVIGVGHIGKIVINMNEQKLSSIFPADQIKKETISGEGDEYSIIRIMPAGESKASIELETMCMDICLISRINLYSGKYKTVKGLGVGSLVSELKKIYTVSSVIGGDKGIMIFIEELPQTAFVVNVPGLKTVAEKTYKIADIPENSKIERVYMY
jgi:hypothetical protein